MQSKNKKVLAELAVMAVVGAIILALIYLADTSDNDAWLFLVGAIIVIIFVLVIRANRASIPPKHRREY